MASYNGEKYIKEQILSILPQLGENDELVISDDGSKDKTLEIIKSLNSSKIILLKNRFKKGIVGNFENALKNASGDVIFLADQDDVWLPNKIRITLPYFQDYDMVVSNCCVVDKELKVVENFFYKTGSRRMSFLRNLYRNPYLGCCVAFKRKIFKYALPFPKKIAMHDIWLGLINELNGTVLFLDQNLILYRRHGQNASPTGEKSENSINFKIVYRLYTLLHLVFRTFSYQLTRFLAACRT
jgi:glycosyltransferase involved in cell wall biosynthesis